MEITPINPVLGYPRAASYPRHLRGEDALGSAAESEASRKLRPRLLSSIAIVAGGLIMQVCMVYQGRESARYAQDYFEFAGPEEPVRRLTASPKIAQAGKVDLSAHRKGGASGRLSSLAMLGAGILVLSSGGRKGAAR